MAMEADGTCVQRKVWCRGRQLSGRNAEDIRSWFGPEDRDLSASDEPVGEEKSEKQYSNPHLPQE